MLKSKRVVGALLTKPKKDQTQGLGMINMQQAWWQKLQTKCYTWWQNGDNTAWRDHVHVDRQRYSKRWNGTRSRNSTQIDTSRWTHGSGHCVIGMRVNFTTMVGRVRGMPVLYQPLPKRTVTGGWTGKKQKTIQGDSREKRTRVRKGKE